MYSRGFLNFAMFRFCEILGVMETQLETEHQRKEKKRNLHFVPLYYSLRCSFRIW